MVHIDSQKVPAILRVYRKQDKFMHLVNEMAIKVQRSTLKKMNTLSRVSFLGLYVKWLVVALIPFSLLGLWMFGAVIVEKIKGTSYCFDMVHLHYREMRFSLDEDYEDLRPAFDWQLGAEATFRSIIRLRDKWDERRVPKVAFLFLVQGKLPLEKVWNRFFEGNAGKYSVYAHPTNETAYQESVTSVDFITARIPSLEVRWGEPSMIDAERRLLARALMDPDNEFFVLLSESCVPIWGFNYVYDFFIRSNHSFVDTYLDKGKFGWGRYHKDMAGLIPKEKFVKGSQWFAIHRAHATAIVADTMFYRVFAKLCWFYESDNRHCIPDEHYIQSMLHIVDPVGISNYSVTFADWTRIGIHPESYKPENITQALFKDIRMRTRMLNHDGQVRKLCTWNGKPRPCFLFARKFAPNTTEQILKLPKSFLGY